MRIPGAGGAPISYEWSRCWADDRAVISGQLRSQPREGVRTTTLFKHMIHLELENERNTESFGLVESANQLAPLVRLEGCANV